MINQEQMKQLQLLLADLYEIENPINKENKFASTVFANAILFATQVFTQQLVLGGAYFETRNREEIHDALKKLLEALK